jgi:hypothetical protein
MNESPREQNRERSSTGAVHERNARHIVDPGRHRQPVADGKYMPALRRDWPSLREQITLESTVPSRERHARSVCRRLGAMGRSAGWVFSPT